MMVTGGEIGPALAITVASSHAREILMPLVQPRVGLVGLEPKPLSTVLDEMARRVGEVLAE
jgi:hypothetical protein